MELLFHMRYPQKEKIETAASNIQVLHISTLIFRFVLYGKMQVNLRQVIEIYHELYLSMRGNQKSKRKTIRRAIVEVTGLAIDGVSIRFLEITPSIHCFFQDFFHILIPPLSYNYILFYFFVF